MSALAILRIPNPKHVQRVLMARAALRIVPPSEGVWPASADTRRMAETATQIAGSGRSPSGAVPAQPGDAQTPSSGESQ